MISGDWSSDVCSSDLWADEALQPRGEGALGTGVWPALSQMRFAQREMDPGVWRWYHALASHGFRVRPHDHFNFRCPKQKLKAEN